MGITRVNATVRRARVDDEIQQVPPVGEPLDQDSDLN
jgi:hypothetical protein